jgi:hypothetical protein
MVVERLSFHIINTIYTMIHCICLIKVSSVQLYEFKIVIRSRKCVSAIFIWSRADITPIVRCS